MSAQIRSTEWRVDAIDPPILTDEQWWGVSLLGVVFVLMAVLQLISFGDFKDALTGIGLSGAATWAIIIILAELWAAAGLFKWRLSYLFRTVSAGLAVLVAGFWFIENLQLAANGHSVHNSALFGGLLKQSPGWWTVIEVTILLFWTLYAVELYKGVLRMPKRR